MQWHRFAPLLPYYIGAEKLSILETSFEHELNVPELVQSFMGIGLLLAGLLGVPFQQRGLVNKLDDGVESLSFLFGYPSRLSEPRASVLTTDGLPPSRLAGPATPSSFK
jgi:hypothetical protein